MHIHPHTHTYTHTCIPPPTTHTTQNTRHTHIHTSMQVHAYTHAHTHTHTHTPHTHIHHKHKHTHCTDHSLWKLPRRNDDVADIRNQLVLHDAIAGGGGSQGGRCINSPAAASTHTSRVQNIDFEQQSSTPHTTYRLKETCACYLTAH